VEPSLINHSIVTVLGSVFCIEKLTLLVVAEFAIFAVLGVESKGPAVVVIVLLVASSEGAKS
jgi:hypothetical protein